MAQNANLHFEAPARHLRGTIERLLAQSYADMPASDEDRAKLRLQWQRADRETFDNPDTIGRCTFITCLNGQPVGMGSFDPRQGPQRGIIGQNCILPAFRGRGLGRRQLEEILRRLKGLGIQTAVVTTRQDAFFQPARKMYEACGFREVRRFMSDEGQLLVRYERRCAAPPGL